MLTQFAPCQGLFGTKGVVLDEIAQVMSQARKKGGGNVVVARQGLEGRPFTQDGVHELRKK
jgi:hypothetical protein